MDEELQLTRTQAGQPEDSVIVTRSMLATAVTRFAKAWERTDSVPNLADYLPVESELRSVVLIELIKIDLEHRWQRVGRPKRLSDYVDEFPELQTMPLPPDLLYEEFHCMRRKGVGVDPDRYPENLRTELRSDEYRSTLIVRPDTYDALERIHVGDRIGDFDILLTLGAGAFARVFLARQRSMERLVALKISHNHGTEPQMLAQLDHQYIVRVFDKQLLEDRDLKLMYMEYLPGGTMLGLLRRARATPPEMRSGKLVAESVDEALGQKAPRVSESGIRERIADLTWPETVAWLGRRLAEALDYSAVHGILHRDIKPANVLLSAEGVPKLADFNISFSNHIAGANPAAYFGGSLAYMSPEQLEACHPDLPRLPKDLDARSDIYALGVMLWELLTGERPFDDDTTPGGSITSLERMLVLRRRGVEQTSLADLPPDCPATLRRVLQTCLAPRPEDRWSTGAELAQQLELCLDPRARNLVDPPLGSLRQRLSLRPLPVATGAVVVGQLLAAAYLAGHNATLLNRHLTTDMRSSLSAMVILAGVLLLPVCGGLIYYRCRHVISVPWAVRRGRRYDDEMLAEARSDTLACGDRIATISFAGWLISLVVLGGTVAVDESLPAGMFANLLATHLVVGVVAAAAPYFLVTSHVVRWYYPALLRYGTTTPTDATQLRRLVHRSTRMLVVIAMLPPVGAAVGTMFLDPGDLHAVIGSIIWLCVAGAAIFALSFGLYRTLDADLAAMGRVVETALPTRGRVSDETTDSPVGSIAGA